MSCAARGFVALPMAFVFFLETTLFAQVRLVGPREIPPPQTREPWVLSLPGAEAPGFASPTAEPLERASTSAALVPAVPAPALSPPRPIATATAATATRDPGQHRKPRRGG